jgi:iron complex transport system substrate-binding protein
MPLAAAGKASGRARSQETSPLAHRPKPSREGVVAVSSRVAPCSAVILAVLSLPACSRVPEAAAIVRVDDWGRTVALAAPARRIVSLAPATTELVFALGLGDRLVGRTRWCDYPPAARQVADVGDGLAPNVEAVAARRPDLVLLYASPANRAAADRLATLGIPVAALALDRAADVRRAAFLVGGLAGAARAADSLVAAFDSLRTEVAHEAERRRGPRPRVYVDVWADPPMTVGRGSYLQEVVEAAGGDNLFDDVRASSAMVSLEAIAQRDPDVIVVLQTDTSRAPDLAARPGWSAVRAVREGRILVLDGTLFGRPSPRMPLAARDLAVRLARLAGTR